MKRNQRREKVERLMAKELDEVFKKEAMEGLRVSPFEAEALVKVVKNVYFPFFNTTLSLKAGQMLISAISEDEPAGKRIKDCRFKHVIITVDAGAEDLKIRLEQGSSALRRHRLQRVCQEALRQGALFTVEDLAYRIFNVGYATVLRDLKILRKQKVELPLRSNQKDIGRSISHKVQIVRLWLQGKEYSQIRRWSAHSISAIKHYIEIFKRVIALTEQGFDDASIAFLTKTSPQLVRDYEKVYQRYRTEAFPGRLRELAGYLKKTARMKTQEMVQRWL